jgi:DNA-binding CsgD family transcriptional regulator
MGAYTWERAAERIAELATRGLDVVAFIGEAQAAILSAVPATPPIGWTTLDPASLLITGAYGEDGQPLPHEVLVWEHHAADGRTTAAAARDPRGYRLLQEVTGGDLTATTAYEPFIRPFDLEHVVDVALRAGDGRTWGSLTLARRVGQMGFDRAELDFLTCVAPHLAAGIRRGLLLGEACDPDLPDAPALVVVGADGEVESLTPGADRWLAELPGRWQTDATLPAAVVAVAAEALRSAEGREPPGGAAVARVSLRAGRWLELHGTRLPAIGERRAAVIVEPAHPAHLASLLMDAYALTEREQDVTRLVLRGDSTHQIAASLVVSPFTVQQHLKRIFDKTGVRSRRELVGKVFFAHYEPRLRDNDRRAADDRPVRGGPSPLVPSA